MKRGNRNFEERVSVSSDAMPDYVRMDINLFDVNNCHNLKLQDLDLRFNHELERNKSRFKVISSHVKTKRILSVTFVFIVMSLIFYGLSSVALKHTSDIISLVSDGSLNSFDFAASESVLVYTLNAFNLFLQLALIMLLFVLILGFFIKRPFARINDGKKMLLILDDVGFYKIDIDLSRNYSNGLDELYFVQFAKSEMNVNLFRHIKSVSYFSSYSKTCSDRKFYVLDLPNETSTYSNRFDLEFVRKEFSKKNFKYLCNYLDASESGGE